MKVPGVCPQDAFLVPWNRAAACRQRVWVFLSVAEAGDDVRRRKRRPDGARCEQEHACDRCAKERAI
ncbi:MAG: hypothetical protein C4296_05275 [Gemmataceae bacterium]